MVPRRLFDTRGEFSPEYAPWDCAEVTVMLARRVVLANTRIAGCSQRHPAELTAEGFFLEISPARSSAMGFAQRQGFPGPYGRTIPTGCGMSWKRTTSEMTVGSPFSFAHTNTV